jgi:hypothetical protein
MRTLKPKVIQHSGQRKKDKRTNNDLQCIPRIILFVLPVFCEYLWHKWPLIYSTCRKHFPAFSSFMIYHRGSSYLIDIPLINKASFSHLKCQDKFIYLILQTSLIIFVINICFITECIILDVATNVFILFFLTRFSRKKNQ